MKQLLLPVSISHTVEQQPFTSLGYKTKMDTFVLVVAFFLFY